MAQDTPMTVIPPTLPPGFCVTGPNIINLLKQLEVFFPGVFSVFNNSPDEPTVENRNKIWVKVDVNNVIVGEFSWAPIYGAWVKNHFNGGGFPSQERRFFAGNPGDIDTYDGGSSGTVGPTTGPFWEIDHDFDDKIPVGVGTLYTPQGTDFTPFTAGAAAPTIRAIYVLKPTGRTLDVA